uniref:Uncharacterized protein n=1 Tax=Oryza meridionalis TaxID=40149 RepID=A0A0E0F0W2_9ORYZ
MRCTPFPQNRDTKSVCIITCIKNMLFLIYGTRLKISDLMDSPKQYAFANRYLLFSEDEMPRT